MQSGDWSNDNYVTVTSSSATARRRNSEMTSLSKPPGVKQYMCPNCSYKTDRKNNLKRHRTTMHERSSRTLECCGTTFDDKSTLRDHVTREHGAGTGYACAQCGRRFGRRALMRRHAAVHETEQQQQSQQQHQHPKTSSSISSSDTSHNGGRPSPRSSSSPVVNMATATNCRGHQHRIVNNMAAGRRRFTCTVCEYSTGHKSNLDRHLRRHVNVGRDVSPSSSSLLPDFLKLSAFAKPTISSFQTEFLGSATSLVDGCKTRSPVSDRVMNSATTTDIEPRWWNRSSDIGNRRRMCYELGCNGSQRMPAGGVSWPTHRNGVGRQTALHRRRNGACIESTMDSMPPHYRRINSGGVSSSARFVNRYSSHSMTPLIPYLNHCAASTSTSSWPLSSSKFGNIAYLLQFIKHLHQTRQQLNYRQQLAHDEALNNMGYGVGNKWPYISESSKAHHIFNSIVERRSPHFDASVGFLPSDELTNKSRLLVGTADNNTGHHVLYKIDGDDKSSVNGNDFDNREDTDDEDIEVDNIDEEETEMLAFAEQKLAPELSPKHDDSVSAPREDFDDVAGEAKSRYRMMPLLHTCRACAVTFVSQLQLKTHADVCHGPDDAVARDAIRPITSQTSNTQSPQLQMHTRAVSLVMNSAVEK